MKLVGKDGSGKSNLKRSLKRERFNPKHTSTEAIEIEVLHQDDDSKAWIPIKEGQVRRMVANVLENTGSKVRHNVYL